MTLDEFLVRRAADKRLARLTHDVVLPVAHGLEFGASNNPVPVPDGLTVAYVDYALEAGTGTEGAVRPDHAWTGSGSLAAICGRSGFYDFAIAAQVAQYVPNLLGWMRGISEVLRIGGVLNLSLPDKRFMFDVRRHASTLGELVEADALGLTRPSRRQLFDHTFEAAALTPAQAWNSDAPPEALPRLSGAHALALAADHVRRWNESDYVLCHCWTFTPLSFLDLMEGASRLRLLPLVISQFSSTEPGGYEFFVSFRRDAEGDPDALEAKQLGAIDHVRRIARRQLDVAARLARTA